MIVRQAMILAAGKGTRMQPLTLTTPKPLVMVASKPLIVWHLERLMAAGITDITINVGYLGDVLSTALRAMNLPINLRISQEPPEPLETAGGIKYALARGLLDDAPFILINGDVWTDFEIGLLTNHALGDKQAHLMLIDNPFHHPAGDFSLQGGQVQPKTDHVPSYTFAGISVVSPSLVADVQAGETAALAPILKAAMATAAVTGALIPSDNKWVDVGTLARLAELEQYLVDKDLENKA